MVHTLSAQEIKEKLSAILKEEEGALIGDSSRILSFHTVSGGSPEEEADYQRDIPACLEWLEELSERMGFRFRNWHNRFAEIEWSQAPHDGERRPVFGIAAHIDVVTPVGTTWTHPPFSGAIAEDYLWGRGAQDDKGPLIQSLYGMYAAKKAGFNPPFDVRVIIGTTEETGDWDDIKEYLEVRGAPDYCFTPDANFPIINGEKGMITVVFDAKWEETGADPETRMEFISLDGGERVNIVPALCEIKLRFPQEARTEVMKELVRETTRFTVENKEANVTLIPDEDKKGEETGIYDTVITFLGKAAHASTPRRGHNAILDALRFFGDIETLPKPTRQFIQFLGIAGSELDGSNLGIDVEHEFIGKTTVNLALARIGKQGGQGKLNIRPPIGLSCEEVLDRTRRAARTYTEATGLPIEASQGGRSLEAIFLDPKNPQVGPFLESLQNAFSVVTGEEPKFVATGGTTYAKAFPNCCAFGPVLLGEDPELAHQADERVKLSSIKRNALIYGLSIALMSKES